jgi:hypothetical protein
VLAALAATSLIAAPYTPHAVAAPAAADAIFEIGDGGYLEPIAVRKAGAFINPGSIDGGPSQSLAAASIAALASAGNRVHVLFGGRVVATVPATIDHTQAHITVRRHCTSQATSRHLHRRWAATQRARAAPRPQTRAAVHWQRQPARWTPRSRTSPSET